MPRGKPVRFAISVGLADDAAAAELQAYVFTHDGRLLASAPVEKGQAAVELPSDLDGRTVELVLGPRPAKGQAAPSAASLKRAGAVARSERLLVERPRISVDLSDIILPPWCLCTVRGRLIKRTTLPDGTVAERPVCSARVHICEVDRIPLVIERLPELELWRLRDDILRRLRPIPGPIPPIPEPFPPIPGPRPAPASARAGEQVLSARGVALEHSVAALAATRAAAQVRSHLADLSQLIAIHLCDLIYLWPFFRVDCLATVEAGADGRFQTTIIYPCADRPDIYIWVEQFQGGAWHTVYRPSIGCGTRWNYACGTELVINLPGAVACEEPGYDIPDGVTQFVLPYAIASTPIWGTPPMAPPAPDGWLRPDGLVNYYSGPGLGWLYNAPFGGTLNFVHDDSYFIPSGGIKYYRYSFRRASATPNTGAADPSWTPIVTPLARGYRMEYTDRLPTYEAYPVGPFTAGANSGLFEFKPQTPPARPSDPPTVAAREWTSGNLSEVAASWDTLLPAPPLSADNTSDDAGAFEVKIEVFDPAGNQVIPGASTFRFLVRNAGGTTTRLATPAEEAGGAYVFRVHLDNNGVGADLPQPSIDGVAASDDCGFLRYQPDDQVHIEFTASHPNDHAVFGFGITRGSNGLASASTTAPYVEVGAASAPTAAAPYIKTAGVYGRDFAPSELVGACVNAAFAASLGVYGKATNGHHRLGLDTSRLIAFALAQHEDPDA